MTTWAELKALAVAPLRATRERNRRPGRGARRECTQKTTYTSANAARHAAIGVANLNGDRAMRPYRCPVCHRWHLAHVGRNT